VVHGVQETHHGLGFFLGGGIGLDLPGLDITDTVQVLERQLSDRVGHYCAVKMIFFEEEGIFFFVVGKKNNGSSA
jgi:hypothetical protein